MLCKKVSKISEAESRVDLQRGTIGENSASAKEQLLPILILSRTMEANKANSQVRRTIKI